MEGMLGRLARWLRMIGYDAAVVPRPPLRVAPGEILLTRRRDLVKGERVFFVRHDLVRDQLRQVVQTLGLKIDPERFFTRCLDCNLPVKSIGKTEAAGLVPDFTLHTAASFTRCPGCGKVFWPGSHGERAARELKGILGELHD